MTKATPITKFTARPPGATAAGAQAQTREAFIAGAKTSGVEQSNRRIPRMSLRMSDVEYERLQRASENQRRSLHMFALNAVLKEIDKIIGDNPENVADHKGR